MMLSPWGFQKKTIQAKLFWRSSRGPLFDILNIAIVKPVVLTHNVLLRVWDVRSDKVLVLDSSLALQLSPLFLVDLSLGHGLLWGLDEIKELAVLHLLCRHVLVKQRRVNVSQDIP